jgi:hypothetical protein
MRRVVALALLASALVWVAPLAAEEGEGRGPLGLTALVLGASTHDVGVFGSHKEDGFNLDGEVRFEGIGGFLGHWLLAPEPTIGFHANSEGNTSQFYGGFTWLFDIGWNVFAGGSLGLAIHDGKEDTRLLDRKELGLRVLFRESAEIGVRLTDRHALSIMLDHISNAGIAENNEGLDTVGIRYTFQM